MLRQLRFNIRAISEALGRCALRFGTRHPKRLVIPDTHLHMEANLILHIGLDVLPEESQIAPPAG